MKMIWKNYSLKKVCVKLSELDYYTTHNSYYIITHQSRLDYRSIAEWI